uniref:PH domain-containing protein n=2 Tax=Guillardia theta TaxID=55529 RepID=A0A7S4ULU8_GUITH|mmetsp:Transcript_9436/g.31539  ORF Transcript_9436/g.31539 Transcript_9436/m.31539 type:complete len:596 (+) Transcript_9436:74-1861(+)
MNAHVSAALVYGRRGSDVSSISRSRMSYFNAGGGESFEEIFTKSEEVKKQGQLLKLCAGGRNNWQARNAILTHSEFLLLKPDHSLIRDVIPVHEITSVKEVVDKARHGAKIADITRAFEKPSKNNIQRKISKLFQSSHVQKAPAPEEHEHHFVVTTIAGGLNNGKSFHIRAHNAHDVQSWVSILREESKIRIESLREKPETRLSKVRKFIRSVYDAYFFQLMTSIFILLNFVSNIVEAQLVPAADTQLAYVFGVIDFIFTVFFGVELLINLLSHWMRDFLKDSWNIFDLVVVSVSLISLLPQINIPLFNSLRVLRIFRAARLIRKLHSLRVLFNAIMGSILPVINSVLVLLVVIVIYAILAVDIYQNRDKRFENLHESLFTMYQVSTGDSWASDIARSLFYVCMQDGKAVGSPNPPGVPTGVCEVGTNEFDQGTLAFFFSYSTITGMILLNVVIAVLLDNFTRAAANEDQMIRSERAKELEDADEHHHSKLCIDPVLYELAQFESLEQLNKMILDLFQAINKDEKAELSFQDLQNGFRALGTDPQIHLSVDDFEFLTEEYQLCSAQKKVNYKMFVKIMKHQLENFSSRQITRVSY